ncbi:MAG: hypothetical protein ACC707_12135 [Thiohalomonadales bacterium]
MRLKKLGWLLSIAVVLLYGAYLITINNSWSSWVLATLASLTLLLVMWFYNKTPGEPVLTSLPLRHAHLANRSVLSLERKADALLGSSMKFWTSIYLSLAIIPTLSLIIAVLMYPNAATSKLSIWNFIDLYAVHAAIIFCIYSIAIVFAHVYERSALDLYDYVFRNHG